MTAPEVLVNNAIKQLPSDVRGKVSDGYHTFDEYNRHRDQLWIKLCEATEALNHHVSKVDRMYIWRSKLHSDGSKIDGYFILGMCRENHSNQMTYHLPISKWDECRFATTLDKSIEYDGHTSNNVLSRLKLL